MNNTIDNHWSSLPCVDHLREGIDYVIVDWDFAQNTPSPTPGTPCKEGEKMVFGVCRKIGGSGEKDFDSTKKTTQEEGLEKDAQTQGKKVTTKEEASAANAKGFTSGGKKFGWAIKGGKPVIVEWGSVAGAKKVGAKQPAAAKGGASGSGQGRAANTPGL